MTVVEEWRPISGFPDYDVSNLGRVRSWRGNGNGTRSKKYRILISRLGTNGRPKYELCNGRRSNGVTRGTTKYEHKLVASAFLGEPLDGQVVRHLDGNPENNNVENLCYGTPKDNIADKKRHGTFIQGEDSNLAKLSGEDVLFIRSSDLSAREISEILPTTMNNVYLIRSNQTWRHLL